MTLQTCVNETILAPISFQNRTFVPKDSSPWIFIGRIARAIGLDGCVKVVSRTDFPQRFSKGAELFCEVGKNLFKLKIRSSHDQGSQGTLSIGFHGITNREETGYLRGRSLFVPLEKRLPLPDDNFYPDELEGMTVINHEGVCEGTAESLQIDCPSPYLVVNSSKIGIVMVPFRKEFISRIDKKVREICLSTPLDTHFV